ncbi:hypothetical protein [Rubellicoccus peritrichatus]|uniref:Uncharacterized protein n=1 Tax=Rubellicoccus peritrichatus TaxID=3080537 RepID=A0AAQ3QX80_9BACT|nr:hypothetical protein [Puniceicoccus sp. CR14]WOO42752.1 hypothetical protein RZN69_06585 [Puniceicoccus sp. CR14]
MNRILLSLLSIMLCFGFARADETWMFIEEYPWVYSGDRDTWVYAVTNEGQLIGYYLDTETWEDIAIGEEVETKQNDVNRLIDFHQIMYWRNDGATDLVLVLSEVSDGVKTEFVRVNLPKFPEANENDLYGVRRLFYDPDNIEQFYVSEHGGSRTLISLPNPIDPPAPIGPPPQFEPPSLPIEGDPTDEADSYSEPREFNTEYPLFGYENYVVEIIDASDNSGFTLSLSIGE